jgi:leucyl aminopeptidase
VKRADRPVQTSDSLWEELQVAGEAEYDRFWRMPLDEDFGPQIYSSNADLCNVTFYFSDCSMTRLT